MAGKAGHNINYLIQAQDEGDAESGIQVSKYNIEKLAHLRTELLRGRGPTYRPPSGRLGMRSP